MGSASEVDGAPNRVQRPRVPDASPPPPSGLRRVVLVVTGVVALALGVLGVALPLLPATPFVLLAAACFAGAWPTMHARLTRSRLFGPMLRAGPGERYLPLDYAERARAVAAGLPASALVLETDAPYLSPQPFRGQRNEPAHLRATAERVAALRGMTLETLARATTANAARLFGWESPDTWETR